MQTKTDIPFLEMSEAQLMSSLHQSTLCLDSHRSVVKDVAPGEIAFALRMMRILVTHVEVMAFGHVETPSLKEWEEVDEWTHLATIMTRRPEGSLSFWMRQTYQALNRAWNVRQWKKERLERTDKALWLALAQFPTDQVFDDLIPPFGKHRRAPSDMCRRPIDARAIHPFLHVALRELESLHAHANGKVPLGEDELACCLHRIYTKMNWSWACRKGNVSAKLSPQSIRRRCQFPRVFLQLS